MSVSDEINRAIAALGLSAVPLSAARTREIARQAEKFARPGSSPLWERLSATSSLQEPDGWRLIAGFDIRGPIILFVEEPRACGFEFETMVDVVAVLGETFGFVFYLVDVEASYLVAFNDHDFLIGAGLAAGWLDAVSGHP